MSSLIREMRQILGEDQEHDHKLLVRRSDEVVSYLGTVRKKLLSYQSEFAKQQHSPFGEYMHEVTGELARIVRDGIVDVERAGSMMEP